MGVLFGGPSELSWGSCKPLHLAQGTPAKDPLCPTLLRTFEKETWESYLGVLDLAS